MSEQDEQGERIVAVPLSDACAEALERAEHACVGISPFNSYFSTERIRRLATWAYERFDRVDFFVPDAPSAHTLEALGYPPEKAAWKARRQGQYTRNRIRTALEALGRVDTGGVWGWAELQDSPDFLRLHAEVRELYEYDREFRTACREATGWVLSGRLPEGVVADERQVQCAVRYFLAELPLFVDTPSIVGAETSRRPSKR